MTATRLELITLLNHLASLAKCLSFCLRTKWLSFRILLLSLKLQIWHLLQARTPWTFRQTVEWIHSETPT